MKLGRIKGMPCEVQLADDVLNHSILITGISGAGKTYAMKLLEKNIIEQGGTVLVLNYNGTHNNHVLMERVRYINVFRDGLPLNIFTLIEKPDGTFESEDDMIESVLDTFCCVSELGVRQRGRLRKLIQEAVKLKNENNDDLQSLGTVFRESEDKVAESVYEHFYQLFTKVRINKSDDLIKKAKINVLDLTGFSIGTQQFLAEIVMAIVWRYYRLWGQSIKEILHIACDEFQVLNIREHSVITQILREGRKHHVAMLLATQTLETFCKMERAVLFQAATQLYFQPAPSEIKSILRYLNVEDTKKIHTLLKELKRGECIANGRFLVGGKIIERPLGISFWEEVRS